MVIKMYIEILANKLHYYIQAHNNRFLIFITYLNFSIDLSH